MIFEQEAFISETAWADESFPSVFPQSPGSSTRARMSNVVAKEIDIAAVMTRRGNLSEEKLRIKHRVLFVSQSNRTAHWPALN